MPCKDCSAPASCLAVCQLWLLPRDPARAAGEQEFASWLEMLQTLAGLDAARAMLDAAPVPTENRHRWPPNLRNRDHSCVYCYSRGFNMVPGGGRKPCEACRPTREAQRAGFDVMLPAGIVRHEKDPKSVVLQFPWIPSESDMLRVLALLRQVPLRGEVHGG